MAFEKFSRKGRNIPGEAMISLLKGGNLGVNQSCNNKYFKDYDLVTLYYDKEDNVIGIQPTREESVDTYTIRRSRKGNLTNISAIAFLKYYGIPHDESKAYSVTWNDEYKLVEVDLKNE